MITADSSLVVPLALAAHVEHELATQALERCAAIPAHTALESFSTLTRMPERHRLPPAAVAGFLDTRFPEPLLTLDADEQRALLRRLAASGIAGGAVYDALIAETARTAGARLLTRDARAAPTYAIVGADVEIVG